MSKVTAAERFWRRVAVAGPDDCWPWIPDRGKGNYGGFWLNGTNRKAHRVSWEFTHGELPVGVDVLHKCDNPPCCNPAHLFIGTDADNVADKCSKNRQAKGDRNGSYTHPEKRPRGERHGRVNVDHSQAQAIRERWETGEASKSQIARENGISRPQVLKIIERRHWTDRGG